MLLQEAATREMIPVMPLMGRPTCMAIPAAMSHALASSLGCIGNRVYTELSDHELYAVLDGTQLDPRSTRVGGVVAIGIDHAAVEHGRKATVAVGLSEAIVAGTDPEPATGARRAGGHLRAKHHATGERIAAIAK